MSFTPDVTVEGPKKHFLFRKDGHLEKEKQKKKIRDQLHGRVQTKVFLDPQEQALVIQEQHAHVGAIDKELDDDPWTIKGYATVRNLRTDEQQTFTHELPPPIVNVHHRNKTKRSGITLHTCKMGVLICCLGLVIVNIWHTFFWASEDYHRATLIFQYIANKKFSDFHGLQLSYKYCVIIGFIPFFTGMGGILSFNLLELETLMVYLFIWSPFLALPLNIYLFTNRIAYNNITRTELKEELYRSLHKYNVNTTGKYGFQANLFWNSNQYHLQCCGVDSYQDWWKLDWGYWDDKVNKPAYHEGRVPDSCCKKYSHYIEVGALNRTTNYSWAMIDCQFHPERAIHKDGCLNKIWENYLDILNTMMWTVIMLDLCTIFASISGFFAYIKFKRKTQPDFRYTITQYFLDLSFVGIWVKRTGKIIPVQDINTKSVMEFEHIADPKIQTSQSSYFKITKAVEGKTEKKPRGKTGIVDIKSEIIDSASEIEVLVQPRESFAETETKNIVKEK